MTTTENKSIKVKTYTRRTPEQQITDLKAKIDEIEAREAAKEAKARHEVKPFLVAVRALDKAMETAVEAENGEMIRALETARAALGEQLVKMGLRAPVRRKREVSQQAA